MKPVRRAGRPTRPATGLARSSNLIQIFLREKWGHHLTSPETFAPDTYWRGNVWPCANWLIHQGLRRYGYHELANDLAARSLALLEQSGFWEYYHPLTGQGYGGKMFGWDPVIFDMAFSSTQH